MKAQQPSWMVSRRPRHQASETIRIGRIPFVVALCVLLDGQSRMRAIIETVRVEIISFGSVGESLAWSYGEGDRTLSWWRSTMGDFIETRRPAKVSHFRTILHSYSSGWPWQDGCKLVEPSFRTVSMIFASSAMTAICAFLPYRLPSEKGSKGPI